VRVPSTVSSSVLIALLKGFLQWGQRPALWRYSIRLPRCREATDFHAASNAEGDLREKLRFPVAELHYRVRATLLGPAGNSQGLVVRSEGGRVC
jgi:hypothetical protein